MASRRCRSTALIPLLLAGLAAPALADLPVAVVSVTSPVARGGPARIEIRTVAAAVCDIEVVYRTGPSRAPELRPRRADAQGRVVWLWRIGKQTPPGKASVTIECLLGEDITRVHTEFTVR